MMKVGLCTIAFREWAVEEALKVAGEVGFDGVEIWGGEKHAGGMYEAERIKRICGAATEAGVEIGVYGSYVTLLKENFADASRKAIEIADGLGTKLMRVWAAPGRPGTLSNDDYALAVSQMADFCKRAGERGMTLAIEAHDDYICETGAAMLQFLGDVGADNLKVNWQASWREHTDDPYESLAALMTHIVCVHAQNFDGVERNRRFLAEGTVDYSRVVRELRQAGYDGYVEVEFTAGDGSVEELKKAYEFLRGLIGD